VFTARYALRPYIKQIRFVFKELIASFIICCRRLNFLTHKQSELIPCPPPSISVNLLWLHSAEWRNCISVHPVMPLNQRINLNTTVMNNEAGGNASVLKECCVKRRGT
jgi:hypothetical protein